MGGASAFSKRPYWGRCSEHGRRPWRKRDRKRGAKTGGGLSRRANQERRKRMKNATERQIL